MLHTVGRLGRAAKLGSGTNIRSRAAFQGRETSWKDLGFFGVEGYGSRCATCCKFRWVVPLWNVPSLYEVGR
jgi:hypothetical protein